MEGNIIAKVREVAPLVHNITNGVTINDVANSILAWGGSPVMADAVEEVVEVTSICGGLTINIGKLHPATIEAMVLAGKQCNALGHPVVLDPVGVGASALRTETALMLLREIQFSVIRGNVSELKTLWGQGGNTKGVDADKAEAVTEQTIEEAVRFIKELSLKTGAIIAMTGAIDLVGNGERVYVIGNGNPLMSRVTGTGCMLSGIVTTFAIAHPTHMLEAVAAAVCAMGLCGEIAYERLQQVAGAGTSSYRTFMMDAMSHLDDATLQAGMKMEVR